MMMMLLSQRSSQVLEISIGMEPRIMAGHFFYTETIKTRHSFLDCDLRHRQKRLHKKYETTTIKPPNHNTLSQRTTDNRKIARNRQIASNIAETIATKGGIAKSDASVKARTANFHRHRQRDHGPTPSKHAGTTSNRVSRQLRGKML